MIDLSHGKGYDAATGSSGGKYGNLPPVIQERFYTNCAQGDPVCHHRVLHSESNGSLDMRRWQQYF